MSEYIVTSFKVIVGVITAERLAISAVVALCLLALWIIFSLIFSFQGRFSRNARKLNEYVSRNGLKQDKQFNDLVSCMPSEFQRGYKNYTVNKNTLPSQNIKRFESLDVELNGGVFNQNKSIIKTYINFVFMILLLFSVAILANEDFLTGYDLAETTVIPIVFLLFAKLLYYVYTAIRQYQYKVAVDDFNDLVDNLDQAHKILNKKEEGEKKVAEVNSEITKPEVKEVKIDTDKIEKDIIETIKKYLDEKFTALENAQKQNKVEEKKEIKAEVEKPQEKLQENKTIIEPAKEKPIKEETKVSEFKAEKTDKKETSTIKPLVEKPLKVVVAKKEEPSEKRGRGRPKKEVNQSKEFVIRNEKDFEEALVRAEKLMRKNEEPLSASQTKRIEKQIKDLVDAMTKYKEQK